MSVILAATDGSEGATRAVVTAAQLSKAWGAKLVIMTATPALSTDDVAAAGMLGTAPQRISREVLSEAKACALRAGTSNVEAFEGLGDPVRAILDFADTEQADMVVVGRRGRGRLAGLLLGSISQNLATRASCPVVVVP